MQSYSDASPKEAHTLKVQRKCPPEAGRDMGINFVVSDVAKSLRLNHSAEKEHSAR